MQFKNIGEIIALVGKNGSHNIDKVAQALHGLDASTMVARMSLTSLTESEKIAILAMNGITGEAARTALGITSVGTASATATTGVSGLGAALKGLWASNPFLVITMGATLAVTAISAVVKAYKDYQQELISNAIEDANSWAESNDSINGYIGKINELKTALDSGTLSEQDAYNAKSELLSIQQALSDSYGSQVAGIDLVNGSLDEQIEKLEHLSELEAEQFLNENSEGIKLAKQRMTDEDHYYL